MKTMKPLLVILIIIYGADLKSNEPELSFISGKTKSETSIFINTTSVIFTKKQQTKITAKSDYVFMALNKINIEFVTGMDSTSESSRLMKILNWDCKVKFRISKNMNILFSYN